MGSDAVTAISTAATNVVILVVIPLLAYVLFHRRRTGLSAIDACRRAGLRVGHVRYVWMCLLVSLAAVGALTLWPPPLEPFGREGSAQHAFVGLGLGVESLAIALLYGVVQTGFSEEFFFRGLIAGSLSRRLPVFWANVIQALVFLLPHLLLLTIMPEVWPLLIVVFGGGLFAGWIRLRSESILGPWILHASVNVTMALSVAIRSVPA